MQQTINRNRLARISMLVQDPGLADGFTRPSDSVLARRNRV
jgi:hypothetical protein